MIKSVIIIPFVFLLFLSCEEVSLYKSDSFKVKIEGYDNNCSTCLISFISKQKEIIDSLGKSPENIYNAINLNQNDFKVGQKLVVKARNLKKDESFACKTQYPTLDYMHVYLTEYYVVSDFSYGDTISISYGECLNDYEGENEICFKTVLSDSRCPVGVNCFWEGEATVRFTLKLDSNDPVNIELSTIKNDTTIDNYTFTLIDLLPYPIANVEYDQRDYKARIVLKKNGK